MAHTYYYGKFPKGMSALNNDPSTGTINDYETGITVFWYAGYIRLRHPDKSWVSLYVSSNYGRRDGYWCVLQPSNPKCYDAYFLEYILMGEVHQHAITEDLARTIGGGKLLAEVVEVLEMPASEKTRQVMKKQRIQQTKWASAIKALAGFKCQATGTRYALEACHIKPFAECTNEEAWDLANGICLTASVHALYDSGLYECLDPDDPLTAIINIQPLKKDRI
ncbi:hypothetical protein TUM12370_12580 [Salmonella enterica subsp. enterica serovar Choleraesuis]|nr:hypothetical protein TUM12370_12580 [Salmonella enterica subsp. enterica serovar Choleraesuis]